MYVNLSHGRKSNQRYEMITLVINRRILFFFLYDTSI
jgi:hypothetical protein